MNLLKQPERWMCGITSFAMLFDLSIKDAISKIKHDGSEIWWPEVPEPLCRRGFHCQEFVDAALDLGYALVQIDSLPELASPDTAAKQIFTADEAENRITRIMALGPGLVLGQLSCDRWHMVAWDGRRVFDPEGKTYSFDDVGIEKITVECFWLKKP